MTMQRWCGVLSLGMLAGLGACMPQGGGEAGQGATATMAEVAADGRQASFVCIVDANNQPDLHRWLSQNVGNMRAEENADIPPELQAQADKAQPCSQTQLTAFATSLPQKWREALAPQGDAGGSGAGEPATQALALDQQLPPIFRDCTPDQRFKIGSANYIIRKESIPGTGLCAFYLMRLLQDGRP